MSELLSRIFGPSATVNSFSVARPAPLPPAERPDVGIRWGKPAGFEYSAAARSPMAGSGLTASFPNDDQVYMRILDANAQISSVVVNKRDESGAWIEVTRIVGLAFAYSEVVPPRHLGAFPGSRTTTWILSLDMHPDDEEIGGVE